MPELPDVVVYLERLQPRVVGVTLDGIRLASPFLLRSVEPPLAAVKGRRVLALRRLGKRLVFALEEDLYLGLHLMIAGRLHWKPCGTKVPGKIGLAAFDFATGVLTLTEAGSKKRASLHLVKGEAELARHDPGGRARCDVRRASLFSVLTKGQKSLPPQNARLRKNKPAVAVFFRIFRPSSKPNGDILCCNGSARHLPRSAL
ncbi:MAG: hypothetical protein FJ271_20335, partial [Planctomycetes bacterium]|nr:hypothetical protein [Planctomycetota bacterium]